MCIYEDAKEYAKYCHMRLDLAEKRCNYFLKKQELADKVVCPNCKCSSDKLAFDTDGGDYPSTQFIVCTECWETFDIEDPKMKDWVDNEREYDDILWLTNDISRCGIKGVEAMLGHRWGIFVRKSTIELLMG